MTVFVARKETMENEKDKIERTEKILAERLLDEYLKDLHKKFDDQSATFEDGSGI